MRQVPLLRRRWRCGFDVVFRAWQPATKTVYRVPDELDKRVAKLKLESMGIKIDRLTPEQEEYLAGWSEGT
jgi:adenosylhomocysteinase